MSNSYGDPKAGQTDIVNRLVRIVILVIVSFLISIAAVSFAVHHMRLQFEGEFKRISDSKVEQVCDIVKRTINGDDISADFRRAMLCMPIRTASCQSCFITVLPARRILP